VFCKIILQQTYAHVTGALEGGSCLMMQLKTVTFPIRRGWPCC